MATVSISEEEIEALAQKFDRLHLSKGEHAFLHAICQLAADTLRTEAKSDEVAGFGFVIKAAAAKKHVKPAEFVVFRISQFTGGSSE
jgi:hypothetical protein